MAEEPRRPFDDREPEPQALVAVALRVGELDELAEDLAALVLGDAAAGVPDLDPHTRRPPPAAHEHAALARVAKRVVGEIGEDSVEQDRIGLQYGAARNDAQVD